MIFGKTLEAKLAEEQRNIQANINGVKKFAFTPKKLKDGRTIWLSFYYEYCAGYLNHGTYGHRYHEDYISRYIDKDDSHINLHTYG